MPHLFVAHRNDLILHALRALHLGCLSFQPINSLSGSGGYYGYAAGCDSAA